MAITLTETIRPLGVQDYLDSPEEADRFENINGEIEMSPSPSPQHGEVVLRLVLRISAALADGRFGRVYTAPVGVKLFAYDIVEPDIFVLSIDRRNAVTEHLVEAAPDLMIEVASPTSRRADRIKKIVLYQRTEVREYWVVDRVSKEVRINVLREEKFVEKVISDGTAVSEVVPGLSVNLAELFADLW